MKKTFCAARVVATFLLVTLSCLAAGEVDPTFNAAAYGELTNHGNVNVVRLQPDGKILVGGLFTEVQGFAASGLVRLNADGTVDQSFVAPDFFSTNSGTGGISFGGEVFALAVLPDGKILVGGNIRVAGSTVGTGVRRLNADGSLDTSFFVHSVFTVYDIELQTDGKIVIGGFFGFNTTNVARLNADGTFDTNFSVPAAEQFKDLELQPDGKIIAVGFAGSSPSFSPRIYRFNPDGAVDGTFSSTSGGTGTVEAVKLLSDGKILVAGSYISLNAVNQGRVSRLNSDGTLDATFNTVGEGAAGGPVNDIAVRTDGKIIIGGGFTSYNGIPYQRLARSNADGTLDTGFINSGMSLSGVVNDVELFADSDILVGLANSTSPFSLWRLGANGVSAGQTFSVRLTRGGSVTEILQQPDGKILAAGSFRFAGDQERRSLARFNADGTLDATFTPYFNDHSPLPIIQTIALQPDGKIIVGAWHGIVLQRLNPDGSRDMTFNPALPSSSQVYDVAVQADGKIVVGGTLMPVQPTFARFNADGSRDISFNPAQPGGIVQRIIIRPDEKILIGGNFGQISDIAVRRGLALYNSDGTLNNSFNPPVNAGGTVLDMHLQPDGKIVHVGAQLRRINSDGTLDMSFNDGINGEVSAVKVQSDGKILIGGGFSNVGGIARNGIARLNLDLSVDQTFTTFASRSVNEIQLQPDGKILIGGIFTRINGVPAVRLARLLNAPVTSQQELFDYDGDGKADISVFRPSENRWYVFRSSDAVVSQTVFAIAGDVPVPADYDGDLKTDVAIYRPSNGAWWYLSSLNGAQINVNWGGEAGDIPRPSDFDGDGKSDFIIFRPTNNIWYRISGSSGITSNVQFGSAGDKPVRGDFDGDAKSDVAIFRPSTGDWWYLSSVNGSQLAVRWGISTDIPAPADFDGDGRTDFAVYRPSTGVWYVINSSNGSFLIGPFGISEDKPVPADYDGDGKADLAVFRPSTGIWYQLRTNGGFFAMQFGVSTDTPTPNAFVP